MSTVCRAFCECVFVSCVYALVYLWKYKWSTYMCICSLMCAFMLMSLIQWLNIAVDIIYITNKPSVLPFRMLRYALTEPKNPPVPDRYRVTDSLTLDMLHDFHHQLMNAVYVEGLVTGNFSPQVWPHPSRSLMTFEKGKCVGSLLAIFSTLTQIP